MLNINNNKEMPLEVLKNKLTEMIEQVDELKNKANEIKDRLDFVSKLSQEIQANNGAFQITYSK